MSPEMPLTSISGDTIIMLQTMTILMTAQFLQRTAASFCAILTFFAVGQSAYGQSGTLITSAMANSSIGFGQSLSITCTVFNATAYDWDPGAWQVILHAESGAGLGYMYSSTSVPSGEQGTLSVTLNSFELGPEITPFMTPPGDHYIVLEALYGDFIPMENSPTNIHFIYNPENQAPTIRPIPNKIVVDTNLLSFTVSVNDEIWQTRTYSLGTSAPTGASIDPTNGLFTWSPPAGYAPRTNQISVIVTDNGSPSLSATNVFTAVVLKPLRLLPPTLLSNGAMVLTWESYPGKRYFVSCRDTLTSTNLSSWCVDAAPAGYLTSFTNFLGTTKERYYQLIMVGPF